MSEPWMSQEIRWLAGREASGGGGGGGGSSRIVKAHTLDDLERNRNPQCRPHPHLHWQEELTAGPQEGYDALPLSTTSVSPCLGSLSHNIQYSIPPTTTQSCHINMHVLVLHILAVFGLVLNECMVWC
ncbi:hypothetical protein Pcinc_036502 [Petrolisthes cinctipes]|uniref:Uncharacterized protein n=1 Tax=Petrolisthes cinctipes TaxID=88211 RepID=A0AAE1EPH7_PETCI|nr:hypothetical protein Pcinc_036502 [Petrolisthes cinctipes]